MGFRRRGTTASPTERFGSGNVGTLSDVSAAHPWLLGPIQTDEAWRYLNRLMQLENWLTDGKPPDQELHDLPPEYLFVITHWPFAFGFFRHSMYGHVEEAVGLNPWGRAIATSLFGLHARSPGEFSALLNALDTAGERFSNQRDNAYRSLRSSRWLRDPVEQFRSALLAYSAYYEAKLPVWLLGVIGKAARTGTIDPTAYGGPNSATAQGSLVDSVRTGLGDSHLGRLLDRCYDPALRNAILHNDYRIAVAGDDIDVVEVSSNRTWSKNVVWERLVATQYMLQSVLTGVQLAREVLNPDGGDLLPDCGTVTCAFALPESGPPRLTLFQLWCFWELDPRGAWLDQARLELSSEASGTDHVRITDRAYSDGEPLRETAWGRRLEEHRCVIVKRIPVCPTLGRPLPTFSRPDGARYEVFGPGSEHLIPGCVL